LEFGAGRKLRALSAEPDDASGVVVVGHSRPLAARKLGLLDRDRVPYSAWIKTGYITATEGNVVDYNAVEDRIVKDCETYLIQEVGFDALPKGTLRWSRWSRAPRR
jgi:phage terminase large subunit-like protein